MHSSYDQIAWIYDEDMGRSAPGVDVGFYVDLAASRAGPALELGCGTGRITLPLALRLERVVGLDRSRAMLAQLRRKAILGLAEEHRAHLWVVCADMSRFAFGERFATIICPYSAFTYLVEERAMAATLELVHEHLERGGIFALDVFIPDPRIAALPAGEVIRDYRRSLPGGTVLERCKSVQPAGPAGVNEITRWYRLLGERGEELRSLRVVERIRYHHPEGLRTLLVRHGFEVLAMRGDFSNRPCERPARMAVFTCRSRRHTARALEEEHDAR